MFSPIKIVRFWLPALIFVVGLAMVIIRPNIIGVEGAALMLGGGLGIVVTNRLHALAVRGEKDRDEEMDARVFMQKYGVWPDEASDEVLDRAERAGDLLPREPAPDAVASGPSPRGPGPSLSPGGTPATAARENPHAPRKAPAEPGTHPHAAGRRTDRARARRPPRR